MTTHRYINLSTEERTESARQAMTWHRQGDRVQVDTLNESGSLRASNVIEGATQARQKNENFEHCKRISDTLDTYAEGRVYRCPDCGEDITMPDDVGDKFKCPHCHEVNDIDDFEQLSLYDYFADILDIEYLVNYRKEYKACKICVAWGGPSIYIDTESRAVELYWWGDRASYSLLSSTVEAVDEWAEEYFNCI